MAFVPAPNIVMIEWRMTLAGQNIENRIMVNNGASPTLANLTSFATGAWDWWENDYSAHIASTCLLREVVATDMSEQNGEQYTYAPDATTAGAINELAMPNEVALCVSLRTGVRGRSARGRWYVAAIPASYSADANNIEAANAEDYRSSLQAYINAVNGTSAKVVIVSYRTNNAPRPGGPVYFIVSSATIVDTLWDSQRRRKPGVGQ